MRFRIFGRRPKHKQDMRILLLSKRHGTRLGCAVFAIAASLLCVPASQAQFGIAAGANFEDLGDLDATDSRASFDRATGYHVGIFFTLGAGRAAIQPGVFMRDFGDVRLVEDGRFRTLSMTSIEVPVDVRLRIIQTSGFAPFVSFGPVVGFTTTTDDGFEDAIRELTVSANVGGGFELGLPASGFTLVPEIRFARSITRYFEEGETFDIGGLQFTPVEVSPQQAVMLRLGIRF